ncbi:nucleotidyltransferase domain-containing protein [Salicibibacter kimchii]|uniref:Nucleotidyltransferase domain-containing protein n=1 Tax=Salicibibacter kimchii TaxID=2099786 RepID=A0A345C1S8_9BACI|nr:nucleotidyltransferase domain-containing protein [Salicibibacter kimchii]AXF57159.1 nucleotidyltransferase domain-containing protein [Salicibibacter kimchii]
MKMTPEKVAHHFIEQFFPRCKAAILGGSAAQKTITEQSDLDIVIMDETESTSYRECFFYCHWDIEAFVFQEKTLFFAFDMSRMDGIPTVPRLCAEGIILKGDPSPTDIQKTARECLRKGPLKWPAKQQRQMRFMITTLLDDLNGDRNEKEKLFSAYKLFDLIPRFVLQSNHRWIGEGKWMYRALLDFDQIFCENYLDAFDTYMKTRNSKPLCSLIEDILEQNGGRLFKGYKDYLY